MSLPTYFEIFYLNFFEQAKDKYIKEHYKHKK